MGWKLNLIKTAELISKHDFLNVMSPICDAGIVIKGLLLIILLITQILNNSLSNTLNILRAGTSSTNIANEDQKQGNPLRLNQHNGYLFKENTRLFQGIVLKLVCSKLFWDWTSRCQAGVTRPETNRTTQCGKWAVIKGKLKSCR